MVENSPLSMSDWIPTRGGRTADPGEFRLAPEAKSSRTTDQVRRMPDGAAGVGREGTSVTPRGERLRWGRRGRLRSDCGRRPRLRLQEHQALGGKLRLLEDVRNLIEYGEQASALEQKARRRKLGGHDEGVD